MKGGQIMISLIFMVVAFQANICIIFYTQLSIQQISSDFGFALKKKTEARTDLFKSRQY